MSNNKIVIDTSAILTTFICNLKCKLCCTGTPYHKNPQHFPLEYLQSCVKRYFEVVDFIRKLSFGGGEPMLRSDLPELIRYTMRFNNQFDICEIITNGTIIPNDEVLDTFETYRNKVFIMIDHYGDISKNAQKLSELLNYRGVNHQVRVYHGKEAHCGGWVDLGDFTHKHDPRIAGVLYSSCCIPGKIKKNTGEFNPVDSDNEMLFIPYMAMTNGLLHRCARSYSTMLAGSVTEDSDNFVNIMTDTKTIMQIREEIDKMMSLKYLIACEYCNGFSDNSKRYEPAEQLI